MDTTSVIASDSSSATSCGNTVVADRTTARRDRRGRTGGGVLTAAVIIAGVVVGSVESDEAPGLEGRRVASVAIAAPAGAGFLASESADDAAETAGVSPDVTDSTAWANGPDVVSDRIGGLAARLHDAEGRPVAGDLFLLMGREGSEALARLHDETPYTHDRGEHSDTRASNELAASVVSELVGDDVPAIEMTSAPGGGPSGGVVYAIAYLNLISEGAFTGDLRVAATGELSDLGYVLRVDHVDEKTSAAHLADADVFFTSAAPSTATREEFGARLVGERVREGATSGAAFHSPERVEQFRRWGADRQGGLVDGMDIVDTRHLIDVAAYFCGTGSGFACEITDELVRRAEEREQHRLELAREADESERLRFRPTPRDDGDGAHATEESSPADER